MEKFLGRGASASVWEAFRSDNHQRVAVKVGSAEKVGHQVDRGFVLT